MTTITDIRKARRRRAEREAITERTRMYHNRHMAIVERRERAEAARRAK